MALGVSYVRPILAYPALPDGEPWLCRGVDPVLPRKSFRLRIVFCDTGGRYVPVYVVDMHEKAGYMLELPLHISSEFIPVAGQAVDLMLKATDGSQ